MRYNASITAISKLNVNSDGIQYYQIELAQIVKTSVSNSVVAEFNSGNSKVKGNSKRLGWAPITAEDFEKHFEIKIDSLKNWSIDKNGRESHVLMIENPTIVDKDSGERVLLNLQIKESYEPTLAQAKNPAERSFRTGDGSFYFLHNNKLIFSTASVIKGEPTHQLFDRTELKRVSAEDAEPLFEEIVEQYKDKIEDLNTNNTDPKEKAAKQEVANILSK